MKKIVLSLAAVLAIGFSAQAQDKPNYEFKQSNIFVEGNLGMNSKNDKNTDTKTTNFNFNPKAGYMLDDKFAVGASFEVGNGVTKINDTKVAKDNTFYGGVFGRYHFLELGSRFTTFAEVGIGFASEKDINDVKNTGIRTGLDLGFNYFLTEKIALTFTMANILSYQSMKMDEAKAISEFEANINVFDNIFDTAKFGLVYKF